MQNSEDLKHEIETGIIFPVESETGEISFLPENYTTEAEPRNFLDEGIETAQCLTYAEGYKNFYMLLEIIHEPTHFRLTFPILQLDEEVNPDELISTWIIKNNISNIAKDLTVKPVNIVGIEHDILVFAACINNDNSD